MSTRPLKISGSKHWELQNRTAGANPLVYDDSVISPLEIENKPICGPVYQAPSTACTELIVKVIPLELLQPLASHIPRFLRQELLKKGKRRIV
jgi:hypothetical protein